MKKSNIAAGFILSLAAVASFAQAVQPKAGTPANAAVVKKINDAFAADKNINGKIDAVLNTSLPGIFEVQIDKNIIYVDSTAKHVIQGHIFDLQTRKNLTQVSLDKLTRIDFSKLPIQDAVAVVRGNGKRKVAIFQDPNCGYCKKIEQEIKDVTDITVYVFMYPILGKDSTQKVNNLWCAADRSEAWENWMLRGAIPSAGKADCDLTAIDRNLKLGRSMAVNGTPAVFFEDGSRIPGALSAKDLEAKFASLSAK